MKSIESRCIDTWMVVEWNILLRNNLGWELTKTNVTLYNNYEQTERRQSIVLLQTTFTSHPLNVFSYWNVNLVLSEEVQHNVKLNPTNVQRVVIEWVGGWPVRLPHWHSRLRMSGGKSYVAIYCQPVACLFGLSSTGPCTCIDPCLGNSCVPRV